MPEQRLTLTIDGSRRLVLTSERITVQHDGLITLKCPHCGKMKPLGDFGTRQMKPANILKRNQPWCKDCRS
jgi:hypothetical protein